MNGLLRQIAERRNDQDFVARIHAAIERERGLFERLA